MFGTISHLRCSPSICSLSSSCDSPLTYPRAISYKTLTHTLDQAALLSAVHNLLQQQNTPVDQPPPYQKFATPSIPSISSLDDRIVRASKKPIDDQRASSALGFQSRWLRKAWHLETLRSYGTWTFSLRSWNILSPDASILEIIRQDNVLEFQKQLSYGLVTMDDRDARGITLFRVRHLLSYPNCANASVQESLRTWFYRYP